MLKLSIITINYNNSIGLKKTMESVFGQTSHEFEYIVVDGDSVDGSKEVITQYDNLPLHPYSWITEIDNGIYQAMNKGIRMAKGEFIQFLNSGDLLVNNDVTELMLNSIPEDCNIFYGNMLKQLPKKIIRDSGFTGRMPTMFDFYTGTLNHSPTYIKRSLFETYGLYDESLKIVSDWKWYLNVMMFNNILAVYNNIDVSIFDMNGISNINPSLEKFERSKVLKEMLPLSILQDYEQYFNQIDQFKRLNHYWIIRKGCWFIERLIFQLEKWNLK